MNRTIIIALLAASAVIACDKSQSSSSTPAAPPAEPPPAVTKAEAPAAEPKPTAEVEKKAKSEDPGALGIRECDEYVTRARGCLKSTFVLDGLVKKWKEALARGEDRSKVTAACVKADSLLRCPKK
jgi:hypothetical protein